MKNNIVISGIIRLTLSKNLDKYRATELSSKIKETGQEEGSKGKTFF